MERVRICPDCGEEIYWNEKTKLFQHDAYSLCYYAENAEGKRVWGNKEQIAKWKEQDQKAMQKDLERML